MCWNEQLMKDFLQIERDEAPLQRTGYHTEPLEGWKLKQIRKAFKILLKM